MSGSLLEQIGQADKILIGIGEEFDGEADEKLQTAFTQCRDRLGEQCAWMKPALLRCFGKERDRRIQEALERLAEVVEGRDSYVVTTSVNDLVYQAKWPGGRVVAPCGGSRKKQCPEGCEEGLTDLVDDDWQRLSDCFARMAGEGAEADEACLGVCPKCGKPLICNNIYTGQYDEKGYLPEWARYRAWLQNTVNRKLLILELGVSMACPSVIRFPFEKIAYYNQKAVYLRVNHSLCQTPAELKGRAEGVRRESTEWLLAESLSESAR